MGNALRLLYGHCCKPAAGESDALGHHGVSAATVGVSALAHDLYYYEITSQGLLTFYGLPLSHTLVELSAGPPSSLPEGLQFELQTLPVDAKSVVDGDGITVYLSTMDPRESSSVPIDVQIAVIERSKARAGKNYAKADALRKQIVDSGYNVLNIQSQEILARKYRIRLRGIDAPESEMPYGKEAKEELTKLFQGKCLSVLCL